MRLMSTSPWREDNGFSCTTALVECSPEERQALERLIDEFHPMVDIFSLRVRLPNVVELDVQSESAAGDRATDVLRERLGTVVRYGIPRGRTTEDGV